MRYTDSIGSPKDFIERKLNRPKYSACPQCGRKGKLESAQLDSRESGCVSSPMQLLQVFPGRD